MTTQTIRRAVLVAILAAGIALLPALAATEAASALIERAQSLEKHEASLAERVALIAQGGPSMAPELIAEVSAGRANQLTVTALGFLADPSDEAALDALAGLAFGKQPAAPRQVAVEALLRVGGPGVDRVTAGLAGENMPPTTAAQILEVLWQVPDVVDLRRALSVVEGIARNHPDSRIRTLAGEYGVPRLQTALAIRLAPESARSRELLEGVLADREPAFAVLSGGRAEMWAAEGLARWHGVADAGLAGAAVAPLTVDRSLADLPPPPDLEAAHH